MSGDPSPRPIEIRTAGPADTEALRSLLAELGYPVGGEILTERMDRAAAERSIHMFVAEHREAIVGFASLHVLPPLARLSAIVVAESARRRGVGLALIERIEKAARAAGCDRMEVTSGEWRADAHAFYRDLGFEETSKRFIKGL